MSTIQNYLPIDRRFAIASGTPVADFRLGAALFADISGFTSLTAALYSELGSRRGAEMLVTQLNRVYTALIAEIHSYGGMAINFGGDSITCWFDDLPGSDDVSDTPSASLRAVACGLELQRVASQLQAVSTPGGTEIPLGLKVAITYGRSRRLLVGDPGSYVLEVLAGSMLDQMAAAEELALRGEVIASAEVLDQLEMSVVLGTRRVSTGQSLAVIKQLTASVPRTPWPEIPQLDDDVVRPWLLPPVYSHLQQSSEAFLAELRHAVMLFVRFKGIDYDHDEQAGSKLDDYICRVQAVLDRYEGYMLQISMGDKGGYLHASFGAPTAHENDTERAAAAALEIRKLTDTVGYLDPPQIGISQGLIHSGAYGSPARSTYGVIGNEVNISARLMSAAEPGQILVSERVATTIEDSFEIGPHPQLALKGVAERFSVRVLKGRRSTPAESPPDHSLQQMIGRLPEQSLLDELLSGLLQGEPGLLIVEGEAGMGKSLLTQELIRKVDELDHGESPNARPLVLVGHGDAIELSTPYYAWRPVFERILDLNFHERSARAVNGWQDQFVEMLDPDLRYLVPLLNVVLPIEIPETALTEQITGEARQDNTHLLLVNILKSAAAANPLVLIMDDAHWLDSVSWTLARRVQREIEHLLLVLVTRPTVTQLPSSTRRLPRDGTQTAEGIASPLAEFRRLPSARHILLDTLPPAAIQELICLRLGITELPPVVARLIQDKAEGHPFFSEELAYALRDARLIEIIDGQCRLLANSSELEQLDFPNSIEGVITSRIDVLPPNEQLTVKVASVIGRSFSYRLLHDIYPVSRDVSSLQHNLDHLDQLDITLMQYPEPNLTYFFKHILTQEVVYGLMTSSQQEQLHQDTAKWFENSGDDLERFYSLIGHHYRLAGNRDKAAQYYGRAGENAFRDFANQEAVRFLSLSLELAGDEVSDLQRAHWHTLIGEASYRLTQIAQSQQHYLAALTLLGQPVPGSKVGRGIGLVGAMARQAAYRLLPNRFAPKATAEERLSLLEAARAADGISEVYYNAGDELASFYYVMTTQNLADKAGPSPELMRSNANLATTFAIASIYPLAETYRARALAMADTHDDLVAQAAIQVPLSVYSLWIGAWERAEGEASVALEIYSRLGDWRRWGVVAWVLPQVAQGQGELERARDLWLDLYQTALRSEDTRHQVRSRGGQFYNFLTLGQSDNALEAAAQVDALLDQYPEVVALEERMWFGLRAWRALFQGNLEEAHELIQKQIAAIDRARLKFDLLGVFAAPAETLIALWEQGVASEKEVQQGLKILNRYARMYPFARAYANRLNGRYAWLSGKTEQADKYWRKSLSQAEDLAMPTERELTLAEMESRTSLAVSQAEAKDDTR